MLEDVNVEHLLNVFTSIDTNSVIAWDVCACFMRHLYWHKKRLVVLGPKIECLPDDHRSKPRRLLQLSRLFQSVGNYMEQKRLLAHTLKLWRERGDHFQAAQTLRLLSDANKRLGLHKEGIPQAKEALEIYERPNDVQGQALSLHHLTPLLYSDKQYNAAEEAVLRAIDLSGKGNQFLVSKCYCVLGQICHSRGETEKAIEHFETTIKIASTFNWHDHLFGGNFSLAELFFSENRSDDAHTHVERAKPHARAINDAYLVGRATELQAGFWYKECKFAEAKSEALRAADVYEGIGTTVGVENCKTMLRGIEEKMEMLVVSGEH